MKGKPLEILGLTYYAMLPQERRRLRSLFLLLSCLHALAIVGFMWLGFGFEYIITSFLFFNASMARHYYLAGREEKPYIMSPLMDYLEAALLLLLLSNICVFFFLFSVGPSSFVEVLVQRNSDWLDRILLLPFLKVANFSWNWDGEILRRVYAIVFLVYSGLLFVFMSFVNIFQASKFVATFYKKEDSPGQWLFIVFSWSLLGLASCLLTANFQKLLGTAAFSKYEYSKFIDMIALSWGLMAPLGGWIIIVSITGYVHYLIRIMKE